MAKTGNGLVKLALLLENSAEAVRRFGEFGRNCLGALKAGNGVRLLCAGLEGVAEVI